MLRQSVFTVCIGMATYFGLNLSALVLMCAVGGKGPWGWFLPPGARVAFPENFGTPPWSLRLMGGWDALGSVISTGVETVVELGIELPALEVVSAS